MIAPLNFQGIWQLETPKMALLPIVQTDANRTYAVECLAFYSPAIHCRENVTRRPMYRANTTRGA